MGSFLFWVSGVFSRVTGKKKPLPGIPPGGVVAQVILNTGHFAPQPRGHLATPRGILITTAAGWVLASRS